MKHVFLVKTDILRLYELATAKPIDAFNRYSHYVAREVAHTFGPDTPNQYCHSVAWLFDYCYETGVMGGPPMPPELAQQTISMYWDFLTKGVNSKDFIVRKAAKALGRKTVQEISASTYLAGVNHFLHISQAKLKDMQSLLRILTRNDAFLKVSSLPQLEPRTRNNAERDKISSNSLTFGNSSSNIHQYARGGLPGGRVKHSNVSRHFPTERVLDLLHNIEDPMLRCVSAMIAAGGVRHSEAWGIRDSDIDVESRTIKIEDPNFHRNPAAEKLEKALPFKGRSLATIVMFEPFKTIFFDSLADYKDIRPTTDSEYLFISSARPTYGQALIHTAPMNSLNKQLNRALRKAQVDLDTKSPATRNPYTSHSLRHFYGVWARNFVYLPGRNMMGLSLPEIKVLMGHKDIRSTERYARLTEENTIAEIEAAERMKALWGKKPHIDQIRSAVYADLAFELSRRIAA